MNIRILTFSIKTFKTLKTFYCEIICAGLFHLFL